MNEDKTTADKNNDNSPAASAAGLSRLPRGMKPPVPNPWEHFYWQEARKRMVATLLDSRDAAIVALVGPSGVGKSALAATVIDEVLDEIADDYRNPGLIPFGFAEVRSGVNRLRIWPSTIHHLLHSLHEPLIEFKMTPDQHPVRLKNKDDQAALDLEACCRNRRVACLVLDEFHHALRGTQKESQYRKMEVLKGLANTTGSKSLIIGTTDVLEALGGYPETGRRTVVVPMPRYALTAADLVDFTRLLRIIDESWGDELEFKLAEDLAYSWDGCKGCVGVLSVWLENSRAAARAAGTRITKKILDREMKPAAVREKIDEEAQRCEAYVAEGKNLAATQLEVVQLRVKELTGK